MKYRNMRLKYATFRMAEGDGGGGAAGDGDGDSDTGGAGGGDGDHWAVAAGLPEDVRSWQEVQTAKTPEDFYKQMGDMRSRLGRSVTIPSEDAGESDWQAFFDKLPGDKVLPAPTDEEATKALYSKLGTPAEADKYSAPEGLEIPDEQLASLKTQAFEAGLTQSQFERYAKRVHTEVTTAVENEKAERAAQMTKLAEEWGTAFEARKSVAEKVRAKFFEFIPSEKMDAATMRAMFEIGNAFGGNGAQILNQSGGMDFGMTPAEASERISEIWNNPDHPYHHPNNPGYKVARQKMRELYKAKDASGETSLGLGNGATVGVGGIAKFE